MKIVLLTLGLLFALQWGMAAEQKLRQPELWMDPPPRVLRLDTKNKQLFAEKGRIFFGITVPEDAGKPAAFAGKELARFLGKALQAEIPVKKVRDPQWKYAIILGDSTLSRKAGIRVSKLWRDGFYIRTVGNNIYIAGRDEKNKDPIRLLLSRNPRLNDYERGTIFGAYEFLERFAGVRFYLPNRLGTIIPELPGLELPRIDLFDRPDHQVRSAYGHEKTFLKLDWMDKTDRPRHSIGNLLTLRHRAQTRQIPNCHGLMTLGYYVRFGKTHPEYFSMDLKGKRLIEWPGYLCFSQKGIVQEIIEDAKSALRGEPASKRGIVYPLRNGKKITHVWMPQVYHKDGFFNVHLMDGYKSCHCSRCKGRFQDPEQIWQMTADVAKAVKNASIPGYITQMGYHFYRRVPNVELPDNVLVQYAVTGPWGWQDPKVKNAEIREIREWKRKLHGKKIFLWNYYYNKWDMAFPGCSQNSPKAVMEYYKTLSPDIYGAFMEGDIASNDLLNLYFAFKILWNTSLDPQQLLDEFYSKMFGKAAVPMKRYFTEAEEIWVKKVRGRVIETSLGPKPIRDPQSVIWEKYYSEAVLKRWEKWLDQAENLVRNSPDELARVRFFRKRYFEPALKSSQAYRKSSKENESLSVTVPLIREKITLDGRMEEGVWKKGPPCFLGRCQFGLTPIRAVVKVLRDEKYLYFGVRIADPEHARLVTGRNRVKGQDLFDFTTFEIFLNPNGDRDTLYQYCLNPCGTSVGYRYPTRKKWGKEIKKAVAEGNDFWSGEIAIPLSMLPDLNPKEFPANFGYNRRLKGAGMALELYSWSPYLRKLFREADRFGKLCFEEKQNTNLIDEYDFASLVRKGDAYGKHWGFKEQIPEAQVTLDKSTFVTGGNSLKMSCLVPHNNKTTANCWYRGLKLKPGKRYRFSYYMKTDLTTGASIDLRIGSGKTINVPRKAVRGKNPWNLYQREFIAGREKTSVMFWLKGCGTVWIDHIVLKEIK